MVDTLRFSDLILPTTRGRQSELPLLFAQLDGPDLRMDEIPHPDKINAPFRFGAHEKISPNSGSGNRVVDEELKGTMNANKLLD